MAVVSLHAQTRGNYIEMDSKNKEVRDIIGVTHLLFALLPFLKFGLKFVCFCFDSSLFFFFFRCRAYRVFNSLFFPKNSLTLQKTPPKCFSPDYGVQKASLNIFGLRQQDKP